MHQINFLEGNVCKYNLLQLGFLYCHMGILACVHTKPLFLTGIEPMWVSLININATNLPFVMYSKAFSVLPTQLYIITYIYNFLVDYNDKVTSLNNNKH